MFLPLFSVPLKRTSPIPALGHSADNLSFVSVWSSGNPSRGAELSQSRNNRRLKQPPRPPIPTCREASEISGRLRRILRPRLGGPQRCCCLLCLSKASFPPMHVLSVHILGVIPERILQLNPLLGKGVVPSGTSAFY